MKLDPITKRYDGFSIQVFQQALDLLGYDLPHQFVQYDGDYPELILLVYNKVTLLLSFIHWHLLDASVTFIIIIIFSCYISLLNVPIMHSVCHISIFH